MKYVNLFIAPYGDSSFKKRGGFWFRPYMKLFVSGDAGIVRMEFSPGYHLLQMRRRTVRGVTNLQLPRDAQSKSAMLQHVSWRRELTWS